MAFTQDDFDRARSELRAARDAGKPIPVPPQELIDWVGGGKAEDFDRIGSSNGTQLLTYGGLRPDTHVLEPGCGCGRNARWIAPYLDPARGAYEGFDIHRGAIAWAADHVTSAYPNARFSFADVFNEHYNPEGSVPSAEFVFPYDADAFDLVFLPSVFTHMVRPDFEQYVREIARVLRPGGVLIAWHFLLTRESRKAMKAKKARIRFKSWDRVSRVISRKDPCAAIAFDESYARQCYEAAGLRVDRMLTGIWTELPIDGYADYQDRILAHKPA
jgi:SAM-dependent methyltransferase